MQEEVLRKTKAAARETPFASSNSSRAFASKFKGGEDYKNALTYPGHLPKYPSAPNETNPAATGLNHAFPTSVSKNNSRTAKLLSPDEEAEHRVKNLCFYCHQKYSRDHRCPQRERFQLHYIDNSDLVDDTHGDDFQEAEQEFEDEANPKISLHAIEGVDGLHAMRVPGTVGKKLIQILIDNGSTHDLVELNEMTKSAQEGG